MKKIEKNPFYQKKMRNLINSYATNCVLSKSSK